jgi:hypothetical protein
MQMVTAPARSMRSSREPGRDAGRRSGFDEPTCAIGRLTAGTQVTLSNPEGDLRRRRGRRAVPALASRRARRRPCVEGRGQETRGNGKRQARVGYRGEARWLGLHAEREDAGRRSRSSAGGPEPSPEAAPVRAPEPCAVSRQPDLAGRARPDHGCPDVRCGASAAHPHRTRQAVPMRCGQWNYDAGRLAQGGGLGSRPSGDGHGWNAAALAAECAARLAPGHWSPDIHAAEPIQRVGGQLLRLHGVPPEGMTRTGPRWTP